MSKRSLIVIGAVLLLGGLLLLGARWPAPPQQGPQATAPAVVNVEPPAATATQAPVLQASASSTGQAITFRLQGRVPGGAQEALLWYDAAAGQIPRRIPLQGATAISTSLTITPTAALTVTVPRDLEQLDYWWAVRDGSGAVVQRAGTLDLPPALAKRPLGPQVPPGFAWQERRTPHFLLRYAPGSAAERDIEQLAHIAEQSYLQASAVISPALLVDAPTAAPTTTVYLVPRVFWQGGVAYDSGTIMISYLDRNYVDAEPWAYMVHETAHALGHALGDEHIEVGGLLGEGVAVFAAGGHYGRENLRERAASLQQLAGPAALCELSQRFYELQHETAYLQAASYVEYLVERFGQPAFLEHYLRGHMPAPQRNEDAQRYCPRFADSVAQPFGETYAQLESGWHAWLRQTPVSITATQELSSTLRFFDLMRRYETERDPPARMLPPNPLQGWPDETLALFLSAAVTPSNVLQESMLLSAHNALQRGELVHSVALMDEVERSLDAGGGPDGPLGRQYATLQQLLAALARAQRLGDAGAAAALQAPGAQLQLETGRLYSVFEIELQQLELKDNLARGLVLLQRQPVGGAAQRELYELEAVQQGQGWLLRRLAPARRQLEGPPGPQVVLGQ